MVALYREKKLPDREKPENCFTPEENSCLLAARELGKDWTTTLSSGTMVPVTPSALTCLWNGFEDFDGKALAPASFWETELDALVWERDH